MFDFDQILKLAELDPGHNLLQCVLLAMIWWQSRGLKKEIVHLREVLHKLRSYYDARVLKLESRVDRLELNPLTKHGKV